MPSFVGSSYALRPRVFDVASERFFAAVEASGLRVNDTRKILYDELILRLKQNAIWDKLDCLYMFAASDNTAALINIRNPGTFDATAVNSPTFTADRGFTGNGSTSYISSNFIPSTAGGVFAQNSAHFSGRSLSNLTGADSLRIVGNDASTTNRTILLPRRSGAESDKIAVLINDSTLLSLLPSSPTTQAHFLVNRSGASARQVYRNGVSVGSDTTASGALPTQNIVFDRDTTNYATLQLASGSIGGSLNATDVAAFYAADLAYMQGVGAA